MISIDAKSIWRRCRKSLKSKEILHRQTDILFKLACGMLA